MKRRRSIYGGHIAEMLSACLSDKYGIASHTQGDITFEARRCRIGREFSGGVKLSANFPRWEHGSWMDGRINRRLRAWSRGGVDSFANYVREAWSKEKARRAAVDLLHAEASPVVENKRFLTWLARVENLHGVSEYSMNAERAMWWLRIIKEWKQKNGVGL